VAKALTDIAARNLKPGLVRREVPDGGAKGLRLVVQPSGTKTWAVRYRAHGRMTKLTLGDVSIGIAAARKLAGAALFELAQGIDPAEAKRTAKKGEAATDAFRAVAAKYMTLDGNKLRSAHVRQRTLERLIYPRIGNQPISTIKRSEIVSPLDDIETNNGRGTANLVLNIIRKIMNWYAIRSDTFMVPLVKGMGRVKASEQARARILTDDELKRLWQATAAAKPFYRLLRFLLLTGARRDEARFLQIPELADGVWTLPAIRNKTGQELARPLSKAALAILAECPRVVDCPFVFTTDGRTALGGISRRKDQLDTVSDTKGLDDPRPAANSAFIDVACWGAERPCRALSRSRHHRRQRRLR
jgi:integrase